MKLDQCVCIAFVLAVFCSLSDGEELNEYISHYEGLTYDTEKVHNLHNRAKRATDSESSVHIKFNALGRNFNLRLKRDTGVFSKNLQLEFSDGTVVDHVVDNMYGGYLKGDANSYVHGSVIKGIFTGVIRTSKETYYVEKVENYFKDDQPFHSVVYNEKDVKPDPHRLKRAANAGTCGSSDNTVRDWMRNMQNSATETSEKVKREVKWDENLFRGNSHQNMYSAYHNIHKRTTAQQDSSKRTCTLFLQSDPYLWKYMTDPKDKNGLGYDSGRAAEEITSLFGLHVRGIKEIYENTNFKYQDMFYIGFSFVVRRIKIMKFEEECIQKINGRSQFCEPHIDVTNFLNLNSLTKHDEYCLAYVFTYRDFTGGTLGLAWVGAPTRASGGICERWKEYSESNKKIYKSLNTGIVTLVNYGSRVPPKVSTLTFAHEVGHNFGSPHDNGAQCTPFTSKLDERGNFIMFASATSGERPNNSKFSPCSIGNMTLVIDAVLHEKNGKKNCFVDSEEAYCGNNIVEEGEKCDCGFHEDCTDSCCYGRPENPSPQTRMCELKPNVQCSPSQGPCCFANCTNKPAGENCLAEQSCTMSTSCDGLMPQCPDPAHKPNETFCNENTQICISGECQGSICSKVNWHQCYLTTPENQKNYDKGNLCFVACENPVTKACVSSSPNNTNLLKTENKVFKDFLQQEHFLRSEGIKLPPGAPCDNFQGYCDVFQKCRGVDADGPLARLKNLLFSEETLNTIKDWIIVYWWGVLLMAVGFVVLMGLFIHCCSVHTPSSNPNKPPARKITHTLSRRNRPQGPPPGYPNAAPSNRSLPPSNNHPSSRPPPYNPYPPEQYEMKHGYPHGGRV